MESFTRRSFNTGLLHSLLTYSLVETLCRDDLLAAPIRPLANRWLAEVEEITRGMKNQQVRQREWQEKIEELFTRIELNDLLRAIDFDRLSKGMKFPDDREAVMTASPSVPRDLPGELSFSTFIYGLKQGRAIVPHCHKNMTSMHMVIGGELHGWHFDRIADEPKHLIIRPTLDKQMMCGEVSTTSDDRDNIHWFKAVGRAAFTPNPRLRTDGCQLS